MSSSDQESVEPIEISTKKTKAASRQLNKKQKYLKKQPKSNNKISSSIRAIAKQKIEDQQLLKQLQQRAFDFSGHNPSKMIVMDDATQQRKSIPELGVTLVKEIKRKVRAPTDRLSNILMTSNHLRQSLSTLPRRARQ